MSTEQHETHAADTTQLATSPTPTTKPAKIPKRVVAGKMVAERTRLAREEQKKAAAEAAVIIEKNKANAITAAPAPAPATEDASPSRSSLSIMQWFDAGTFVISLIALYYKREEFKAVFSTPEHAPEHATCNTAL